MTLDQLRYFVAAATYQHVGRAAAVSAISPSAISTAITALSEELGCELFRRKGRRVELTTDGDRLLERAKAILARVDGLKGELRREPEALSGRYRLGASHYLCSRLLLNGWSTLQAEHPGLVGDFHSLNTAQVIAEVLAGRLDLGLAFSPLTHPELELVRLHEGEMRVVVRKNHPILKRPWKEQLQFLSETPALIHRPAQGVDSCDTHPLFGRLGFVPRVGLFWDSDDVALQSVSHSDRWAFVPELVIGDSTARVRALPLPRTAGSAPYSVSAVILKSRAHDPTIRQLFERFHQVEL